MFTGFELAYLQLLYQQCSGISA